jgi:hypothetical protein
VTGSDGTRRRSHDWHKASTARLAENSSSKNRNLVVFLQSYLRSRQGQGAEFGDDVTDTHTTLTALALPVTTQEIHLHAGNTSYTTNFP